MTGTAIFQRLAELFPNFVAHAEGSYFRRDDGSFTPGGAFAEFSHYFRDGYERLPRDAVGRLGQFISECVASEDQVLSDAATTCFPENVGGERFDADFEQYLSGPALTFYRMHGTGPG